MAGRKSAPSSTRPGQENNIRRIPTDDLLLDAQNPRLTGTAHNADQETLLKTLWTEGSLDELAWSIAKNGYFPEEPLFVIEETNKKNGSFIVVEGNRRLATVKILRDPQLQKKLHATDIPTLGSSIRENLETLPVSVYPDRKSLWTYLGFRHVNGPLTWDSWSKAQYIAQVHNNFKVSLEDIADSIGDRHKTVQRLYRGLMVLNQASEQAGYDIEDRSRRHLSFSHLYTGLDYAGFQQHLGLKKNKGYAQNPITEKKLPHLKELMMWLYGSHTEDIVPVIKTQNPDLKRLDAVLQHPRSLDALRSGLGLEVAHKVSLGETKRLREALTRARYELQQANGLILEGYAGERDLLDMAENIQRLADNIHNDMRTYNPRRSGQTRGR